MSSDFGAAAWSAAVVVVFSEKNREDAVGRRLNRILNKRKKMIIKICLGWELEELWISENMVYFLVSDSNVCLLLFLVICFFWAAGTEGPMTYGTTQGYSGYST